LNRLGVALNRFEDRHNSDMLVQRVCGYVELVPRLVLETLHPKWFCEVVSAPLPATISASVLRVDSIKTRAVVAATSDEINSITVRQFRVKDDKHWLAC